MPRKTPIAEAITRLREKAGMTQQDVASGAGISLTTYVRLETGSAVPSWDTIVKIVESLDENLSHLAKAVEDAQR